MQGVKSLLGGFLIVAATAVPLAAQQFQYEFRDSPRPVADVMVVSHSLRTGPGTDLYLVGRLFNRGLKPANNVRVIATVTNRYGARYPSNPIYLTPSDIPATSFADFEGRLLSITDARDVILHVRAEWNQ
jgi:hypothetical protein